MLQYKTKHDPTQFQTERTNSHPIELTRVVHFYPLVFGTDKVFEHDDLSTVILTTVFTILCEKEIIRGVGCLQNHVFRSIVRRKRGKSKRRRYEKCSKGGTLAACQRQRKHYCILCCYRMILPDIEQLNLLFEKEEKGDNRVCFCFDSTKLEP